MTNDEIIEGTLKALLESREDLSQRLCIGLTRTISREEFEKLYPRDSEDIKKRVLDFKAMWFGIETR